MYILSACSATKIFIPTPFPIIFSFLSSLSYSAKCEGNMWDKSELSIHITQMPSSSQVSASSISISSQPGTKISRYHFENTRVIQWIRWMLPKEFSLPKIAFPFHQLSLAQPFKPIFSQFVNMFLLKHDSLYTFLCKFHMVCTSQPLKIWWQTSVQAWSTVWFATILNSL